MLWSYYKLRFQGFFSGYYFLIIEGHVKMWKNRKDSQHLMSALTPGTALLMPYMHSAIKTTY